MTIYMEKRRRDFLTLALERAYLLGGLIDHGATTRGRSRNRAVLKQYSQVLEGLLPPMLHLAIEHGPTMTGRRSAIPRFATKRRRQVVVLRHAGHGEGRVRLRSRTVRTA